MPVVVGAITAGIVTTYAIAVAFVLKPLHARGYAQSVLGYLNGLDHVFQSAAYRVTGYLGLRPQYHTTTVAWVVGVALSAGMFFLLGMVVAFLWRWTRRTSTPENLSSRRRFLRASLVIAGAGAATGLGYALLGEPRRPEVTHRTIRLKGLHPNLAGLRLVQLTDIHHGPWLSLPYVQEVVRLTNALSPDVVLLTGDYVHQSMAYVQPVVQELARLRPGIATLAVLGNHDWWENVALTRREFAEARIPLLDNSRRVLRPDRRLVAEGKEGLAVCGIGDLWTDHQDYDRALGSLPESMPRILMSHNPDVAEEPRFIHSGLRVDLMLSGHTHGGQIRLPFLGTPGIPSRYGQKYAQGLVQGPVCPVFVSRGIGVSMLPLRIGVAPEIAILEIQP